MQSLCNSRLVRKIPDQENKCKDLRKTESKNDGDLEFLLIGNMELPNDQLGNKEEIDIHANVKASLDDSDHYADILAFLRGDRHHGRSAGLGCAVYESQYKHDWVDYTADCDADVG